MVVNVYGPQFSAAIEFMLKTHGINKMDFRLPKLGFIVMHEISGDVLVPVCAGFLREVEAGPYLFDSLVSNADLNSEQRAAGMSLLWDAVLAKAGDRSVLGFTVDDSTLQRATGLGFVPLPHTVLSLTRGIL